MPAKRRAMSKAAGSPRKLRKLTAQDRSAGKQQRVSDYFGPSGAAAERDSPSKRDGNCEEDEDVILVSDDGAEGLPRNKKRDCEAGPATPGCERELVEVLSDDECEASETDEAIVGAAKMRSPQGGAKGERFRIRGRRVPNTSIHSKITACSAAGPEIELTESKAGGGRVEPQIARISLDLSAGSNDGIEAEAQKQRLLAEDFNPRRKTDAGFSAGSPAPFVLLARCFSLMEQDKGRLRRRNALGNVFRALLAGAPEDVAPAAYICAGRVAPAHEGIDLNAGSAAIADAVAEVTGVARARLSAAFLERTGARAGDLGDVAQRLRGAQQLLSRPAPLSVRRVFEGARSIAAEKGAGSGARRRALMVGLLRGCREEETRYLVRFLLQNMRIGMNSTLVVGALACAAEAHHRESAVRSGEAFDKTHVLADSGNGVQRFPPSRKHSGSLRKHAGQKAGPHGWAGIEEEALRGIAAAAVSAYAQCPDLGRLVEALHAGGVAAAVECCRVAAFVPFKPMLAKVATSMQDAIGVLRRRARVQGARAGPILVEYKYDGQRAQMHVGSGEGPGEGVEKLSGQQAQGGGKAEHRSEKGASAAEAKDAGTVAARQVGTDAGGTFAGRRALIFSRNGEDCTARFPDAIAAVREASVNAQFPRGREVVLDAEIVGWDPKTGSLLPFQELSTRSRGGGGDTGAAWGSGRAPHGAGEVQICVVVFDLVFLDGQPLAHLPLSERRSRMAEALPGASSSGRVRLAQSIILPPLARSTLGSAQTKERDDDTLQKMPCDQDDTSNIRKMSTEEQEDEGVSEAHGFLLKSIAEQCEGVVVKCLDAPYEPGRRADTWLKVKKDYVDSLADSFDVVPIGAWDGQGRKSAWLSPFLLAVHDPASGELQSLCRCLSGFTDSFYKEASARLMKTVVASRPSYYITAESPQYWFQANEVWEVFTFSTKYVIRGAELSLSPVHQAAAGLCGDRGLALRFPRFLRIREDKSVQDATTPKQIADLFRKQSNRQKPPGERKRDEHEWSGEDEEGD